ncbi:amidohydrolase family protein [Thalassorhabdus alkalitolerans]|uniref:Amidohydrolase family protein n=1 Tax=Thalassorhabdus alkalitolerans TaxID=2282697 RepID=A0ABW0YMN0_9BACI
MKTAYTNAVIINGEGTVDGKDTLIVNGEMVQGIISSAEIPADYERVDLNGRYITPGLIDVHTHLGVHEEGVGKPGADFNETSDPVTPAVRAIDGINPLEEGFEQARQSGVTTVQVMPGSANVIGGEMCTLKTAGTIVDKMVIQSPSGMKAAFGENPKTVYGSHGKKPVTRMGIAAAFREAFIQADNYIRKQDNSEVRERSLGMEQLAKVLKKEIPLRIHAHRADDIVTVLRLAKEFDISLTLEHCTDGHKIAEYIAEHEVMVSVGPTMSSKSKVELADKGWHTLSELDKHGICYSITTDHPVVNIEYLITSAAKAAGTGLSEEKVFQSITTNAARHLGIEDRVGSLEAGKDADFVIWSNHPFHYMSQVEATFINGEKVYERT